MRVFSGLLERGTRSFANSSTYYCNCSHNLMSALRDRVLARVPVITQNGIKTLRRQSARLKHRLGKVTPWEIARVVNHYAGAKRRRYELAAERYISEGVTYRDAVVDLFVKSEATMVKEEFKAPRAIQPRSYVYGVAIAQYVKPAEHMIYHVKGYCQKGVPESRVIAKGLSQTARARLLAEKSSNFSNPVWMTLDASRFDLHVNKEQLRVEHGVYLHCVDDPEFRRLLNMQLVNHGRVREHGIKYTSDGGRMSGDMNTAVGNCVLMLLMCNEALERADIHKYDVLDDGDDIVVILEKGDELKLQSSVKATFLEFGHEVKIENVAYAFEDLEWCQCHPVQVDQGVWKLVRDPGKILGKGLSGTKYFNNPDEGTRRKLVHSLGLCEGILNTGVPVLQAYGRACVRWANTQDCLKLDTVDLLTDRIGKELGVRGVIDPRKYAHYLDAEITPTARESFERAFGISVQEQYSLEEVLDGLELSLLGGESVPEEIDMRSRLNVSFAPSSVVSLRE